MKVSVLITTYNRSALLRRALGSVLAQDHADIDIVVVDDCSQDDTQAVVAAFADPRIRYILNPRNVGGAGGDAAIIRRFLDELCSGEAFVYLCDDDYWIPSDLVSRQVKALEDNPNVAFVQGGMVHVYPHPVPDIAPNAAYLRYQFLDAAKTQVFWGGLYPSGLIDSRTFLRLFAEDPKNRNIVAGATLYRTETFRRAGILDRMAGVRWQAGYAITAGPAVHGDVVYIDEPCLAVAVNRASASHRGTQHEHFVDCLCSIDAALPPGDDAELADIRATMMRSVMASFLCNKIAAKAGWFGAHPLGDMASVMHPPITSAQFKQELHKRGVPLNADQYHLIEWSDILLIDALKDVTWWRGVLAMAA